MGSRCNTRSFAGSSRIPDIRSSCTRTQGNQIQLRLDLFQPKPERQLVSSERAPARLPPMEVKEFFSYISPLFFAFEECKLLLEHGIGAYEGRLFPLIMNRIGPVLWSPCSTKKRAVTALL